jgi:hypothetical protein
MWYVDGVGAIKTPRGITKDGVQHPRNIFTQWSKSDLAAIGIKPASITSVDQRYYDTGELTWDTSGAEAVGTYATTAKSTSSLKSTMVSEVNAIASGLLAQSDWMSIREADGGTAVPSAWATYRTALRTTANDKETEINALADLDAIKAYRAHPVTYTRKTYNSETEAWGSPNVTTDTTVDKVTWTEEGSHADSWPLSPDHVADPSFVSVANT